jgi:hypothetical protein
MERLLRGVIADMDCIARPDAPVDGADSRFASLLGPVGSFPGHDRLGGAASSIFNRTSADSRPSKQCPALSVYRNSRAAVPRVRRRSPVFARFPFQKAVNPG